MSRAICIIGAGAFGRLCGQLIKNQFNVRYFDPFITTQNDQAVEMVEASDLYKFKRYIIAVPIRHFETALLHLGPYLSPNDLVVDTCSVKEEPARLMRLHLPSNIRCVGLHPLFGPQSAKLGLPGQLVAVCPVRSSRTYKIEIFLESLGLKVVKCTPREHDEEMAAVQALTHLVGRAISNLPLTSYKLRTTSFERLMDLRDIVANDSFEMFLSIQNDNSYSGPLIDTFVKQINSLHKVIKADRNGC